MEFKIYKLHFLGMVHFGNTGLEDTGYSLCADTIFSALCHEAINRGEDDIAALHNAVREDNILISDAFPYIGEELYLPKPYIRIQGSESSRDSVIKKAYKKLKYVPLSGFEKYLNGTFDVMSFDGFDNFGQSVIKVSASVRGEEDTLPYRVGMYSFNENNGLYIIVGYTNEHYSELIKKLFEGLAYSGIGGKRTVGLGRFELSIEEVPSIMKKRIICDGKTKMLLSVSLPREDEMISAMEGASYSLMKRSGFVQSSSYNDTSMKKKDLYVFRAGSCFTSSFKGDVYDVSTSEGSHPVYRYAKPLFLEVE